MISWRSAFAFRSLARALAAGLPRQDHVYKTTDKSFRFYHKKFDEMRCKLDSTENLRSFGKDQTPPEDLAFRRFILRTRLRNQYENNLVNTFSNLSLNSK